MMINIVMVHIDLRKDKTIFNYPNVNKITEMFGITLLITKQNFMNHNKNHKNDVTIDSVEYSY